MIATYKSWTMQSILNEDTESWLLFFSNVLIEHSHPPTPFPHPHPALVSICSYAAHPLTLRQQPKQHTIFSGTNGGTFCGDRGTATK